MIPTRRLVLLSMSTLIVALLAGGLSLAQENPAPSVSAGSELSAPAADAVPAQEFSHARIVRLSFVEGNVVVQKPDADEWATAHVNTPLQEGFRLSTAEGGYVEAEFENASTARFGQLSLVEFTQLALLPSGGKVNRLTLHQGYGTFNFILLGDDYYEVKAGSATLVPRGKTRFRVDLDQGFLQVKVFKGAVEFQSPEGNGALAKNTVLLIRPEGSKRLELAQGITKDAWDEWVEQREGIAQAARNRGAPASVSTGLSEAFFGFADLMLYGDWFHHPDYGYVWSPYANPGWGPYVTGQWGWYPGFGYVWISGEPWGWLPYHYGGWVYMGGMGWGWCPRGMGGWSPAGVNWYQGPGWVGWSPRPPRGAGGQPHCPAQGCITAVGEDHFRNGRPVGPNRFPGDALVFTSYGRPVASPDLRPERGAILAGSPRPRPGVGSGAFPAGAPAPSPVSGAAGRDPAASPAGGAVERRGTVPSPPGNARETDSSISRNAPGSRTGPPGGPAPSVPAGISNREVRSPGAVAAASAAGNVNRPNEGVGRIARPGPRENYPTLADQDSLRSRYGSGERFSPRPGASSSDWGSARSGRNSDTPSYSPRGGSGRSQDTSARSSSRSAPSVSSRSGGSGRSSDRGSQSSGRGSWSSGSARGSGHDSGGGSSRSSSSSGSSHSSSSSGGGGRSGGGGGGSSSSGGGHSSGTGGSGPKH